MACSSPSTDYIYTVESNYARKSNIIVKGKGCKVNRPMYIREGGNYLFRVRDKKM
jgi:hypothetical protein